ncbi:hypothetical protein PFZ55_47420 [Streptomyces sp. MS2A]|nr:hypothetical protein [Streptomyces sp. MS2A]
MTTKNSQAPAAAWPGDPAAAWAEAVRSPEPYERLAGRPDVEAADAASIADWIEDQRSLLPMLAIVSAAVGAFLLGGLLLGVPPRPGHGETNEPIQWIAGVGLLIASAVLCIWELVSRHRRRTRPPRLIPEVRMVLCQLHPTRFHIHDGDGYRETCVAISADIPDEQAARVFTAFRIWLGRLHEDREAMQEARGLYWSPQGATVFTSEEIFGSGAAGGYLVRRPNLPADGWAVLITPRRPAKLAGQLRFADIRQWSGREWTP